MAVVLRNLGSIILPRITGIFIKNILISLDFENSQIIFTPVYVFSCQVRYKFKKIDFFNKKLNLD